MGRVIKGSLQSAEHFTLTVPAFGVAAPVRGIETDIEPDEVFVDASAEPAPPAPPEIDFDAIHAQAQAILDAAQSEAKAIVETAQREAADELEAAADRGRSLAEDARRAAHDDGYAGGLSEAKASMAEMLETLRSLVEGVRTERRALLTAAEPELVKLAVGIAERVLHQQIAFDGGVVVEMARAAIARLVDREVITVRVNPADIERMREHRDELLALGDVKTMRVIEDQRVDRGGVILETEAGSIDAKISTQMTEVRKILQIADDVVIQPAPADLADDADEPASPQTKVS